MTPEAHAQSAQDKAAAEGLFDLARKLMREGHTEEACPKLAESQRLDPGVGTLLHLGECYERTGRTASAWATFREAIALARASGQAAREQLAQQRADALETRLVRLTVEVPPPARVPGLIVLQDGAELAPQRWGAELPVDPGPHTLEARAPGRVTFRLSLTRTTPGVERITVPVLELTPPAEPTPVAPASASASAPASAPPAGSPAPVVAPPLSDTASAPASGPTRRHAALALGALGGAAIGVGAFFGLRALGLNDDSRSHCDARNTCDPEGIQFRRDAITSGNLSTALIGSGLLALGAGVTLWLTAPGPRATTWQVHPTGLSLRGTF